MSQWCAHSRSVVLYTLHIGQIDTRLCTYLVNFATLYFSMPLYNPRSLPIFPRHCSPLSFSASDSANVLSLALVRSIHYFFRHRIPARAPGVLTVSSHRSIIDCVSLNLVNVFCLLQIYSSIASKLASSLAANAKVYSHFP